MVNDQLLLTIHLFIFQFNYLNLNYLQFVAKAMLVLPVILKWFPKYFKFHLFTNFIIINFLIDFAAKFILLVVIKQSFEKLLEPFNPIKQPDFISEKVSKILDC